MTRIPGVAAQVLSIVGILISSTLMVAAQNPVPFLSQPLIPSAVAPAPPSAILTLTVNGTGFVPQSTVNWNGSPQVTVFVNSSRLDAFIPASKILVPTTAWITVVSPAPGGGTSNTVFLPVNTPTSTLLFRRTDYPIGGAAQFGWTGDFSHNGKLDLAFANYGIGAAAVLLGNGDGTFQSANNYPAGGSAQVTIIGDFNRDGNLDLAVPGGPGLVLLGRGDGTFEQTGYSFGFGYHGITADFNADGKLDLALADSGVSILLGNGDGSFGTPVENGAGGFSTMVATGDFNRDGILDLVTSNFSTNNVSVLLGNGDGTFRPHNDYPAGVNPTGVVVADFNGDGKLDLAVGIPGEEGGAVAILLGNGDGTFRPPVNYPVPEGAVRVEVADINQDGKLDLIVANSHLPSVNILLGNGDGTFQPVLSFPCGNRPWNAVPADFNGDGRLDIATGNFDDGSVSVLIAQPSARQYPKPHHK